MAVNLVGTEASFIVKSEEHQGRKGSLGYHQCTRSSFLYPSKELRTSIEGTNLHDRAQGEGHLAPGEELSLITS